MRDPASVPTGSAAGETAGARVATSGMADPGSGHQPPDAHLGYLLSRLERTRQLVTAAVTARRQGDPAPDDPFRGLYLSDDTVAWLVDRPDQLPGPADLAAWEPDPGPGAPRTGPLPRLLALAGDFALSSVDVELLLVALLPEVDPRFEQLLGYLNDDVTRRRASVGLALQLCGLSMASGAARARLAGDSPLVAGGLLVVEDADRPFLGRALRVPDRVVAHLLGDGRSGAAPWPS